VRVFRAAESRKFRALTTPVSVLKLKLIRREDFRDRWSPAARRLPTTQTIGASFPWVQRSALRLAPFHKSPPRRAQLLRSLRSGCRPAGARECTSARRDSPSDSDERARQKWRCRPFPWAHSRQSRLLHDRKSRSAVALSSVKQTVSLRCCRAYSFVDFIHRLHGFVDKNYGLVQS